MNIENITDLPQTKYRIGDVAELIGMSRDSLRYYEKRGLLPSKKEDNGYRYYTEEDLGRLISILYQRKMGLGLDRTARKRERRNPRTPARNCPPSNES